MARPKLKGYTVRKRKDCNRWELIIHADHRLGIPQLYNGLYVTKEEAEKEGHQAVWGGVKVIDVTPPPIDDPHPSIPW